MNPKQKNAHSLLWQTSSLLKYHLWAALLVFSLFFPLTAKIWANIDIYAFKILNGSLLLGKGWAGFWSFANSKIHDWIEDVVFLIFFVLYAKKGTAQVRNKKIADCLTIVLFTAFIIYAINKTLVRETLSFDWPSPSLVVDSYNKINALVPWLYVKDTAKKSFPGDHATTAVLFAFLFAPLTKGKMRIAAILYSIFLCLPRLIVGAHWFSDIAVGSIALGILAHAWFFFSPLHEKSNALLRKGLKIFIK